MALAIPSGLIIQSTDPVDARFSVADDTARKALPIINVYEGLLVYEQNTNKLYKLINAAAPSVDASWVEIPDNLTLSLSQTIVGISASLANTPSLEASSSGAVTASLTDGLVWIVAGEARTQYTSSNGETWIWSSGSRQWYFIPKLDQTAGDARYLVKATGGTVSGTITLNNGAKLAGTASWAESASFATTALGVAGGTQGYIPVFGTGTSIANSVMYQLIGDTKIGIGTTSPAYKLDVNGDIATSTGNLYVSSSIIYYGPFENTNPGDNPLKIIQKSTWAADPGIIIGAQNTVDTASSGVTIGGANKLYARNGYNYVIGSSNYLTSSVWVGSNNYIFGYGNRVSGSAIDTRPIGGGAGNQILIGRENISDMSTNGQAACILIGAFNNTNGYRGGGLYGSRLKYYADNQLAFGQNSPNVDFAIRDVFFGMGVRNEFTSVASNNGLNGHGVNVSINPSWAADEADRNAGSLNLNGGRGTGTGSAGDIIFATATTGSTGATLQSLSNRVWIKGHTGNVGIGTSTPSGSLHVSGTVYFSDLTTSSVALTNVLMISSSGQIFTTASSAIGGGGSPATLKAGSVSVASFGTSPLTSSVTFGSAFANNNYAVTVTGEDARAWTIQSKTSAGFQINSNSDTTLTGPVYWIATPFNS